MSATAATSSSDKTPSKAIPPAVMTPAAELAALLEHQKEIQNWLNLCEDRIFEMETSYLDETPGGNMIRGWD